ncbi:hypothetical protein [Natrinema altunense]|uniref:Uncharacterized protein n=1 Tax=Natrinema altunense (strain JCM 12890 / CGMCC 1.3731 / AJ2) TaxID=1227494 RepID=L9ZER6_NATA2|nr:hypothetical protein [Natrinema altunense]ELY83683.1 hypothetical protein C485_18062 [Natrinema altunense JCM 12890]
MSEDEEDVFEEPDFEGLEEALKADREEHREQVSVEWVETVREAGELWRDLEDVEAVADEVGLSLEETREALTVYRLIFDEVPMAVASRAVIPGQSFFSLQGEVTRLDPENESESVEDLLREYVGAVYLEHDIQEEEVGEPPERESPPSGFEGVGLDLDMSGMFPSFEMPSTALASVANMPEFHDEVFQSQVSALAGVVDPDLFPTEQMVASSLQPAIAQHQEMFAQSLAPLTAALDHHQSLMAQSTAAMMSEAVQDIAFPDSVLADLASMQPAMDAAAAATTHTHPSSQFEGSVVDEASKTSVEAEPLEATGEVVPETGPGGAMLDSTLPDADAFTTELVVEVPAMIVESMLSTGKARVWFSNLSEEHQLTAVRLLLASVAVYVTGNPFAAPVAIIPAPSVRRAIVVED